MGALGSAKNKLSMITLAEHVTLRVLESGIGAGLSDKDGLAQHQALLLGATGLLPSQHLGGYMTGTPADDWSARPENIWATSRRAAVMTEKGWHTLEVRPNNFPSRRIAAMSYLLLRYRKTGLSEGPLNRLGEATTDTAANVLEPALCVVGDNYLRYHLDLEKPARNFIPTLLGNGHAADIVVIILLPFASALARLINRSELALQSREIFSRFPKLVVNSVERYMIKQFGNRADLAGTARRQQELLHIYKMRCSRGNCHPCPFRHNKKISFDSLTS